VTNKTKHLRRGHDWLCQFGNAGNVRSCENEFKLERGKWTHYKTMYYNATMRYNETMHYNEIICYNETIHYNEPDYALRD